MKTALCILLAWALLVGAGVVVVKRVTDQFSQAIIVTGVTK